MNKLARLIPLLSSSLLLGTLACAPIDESFTNDEKEDSFSSPTQHGTFQFGRANPAAFSDTEGFHSWTFELNDLADFELFTEVAGNLNTTMHVYRRDPGTLAWGSSIAQSDTSRSSIVIEEAEAGEYRVKVKATEIAMHGHFDLVGSCSGDGCPSLTLPANLGTLPERGMTDECGYAFINTLTATTLTSGTPIKVEFPDVSALNSSEQKALGHYIDYWKHSFESFRSVFGSAPTALVEVRETNGGMIATVEITSDNGEQSGLTLVYDNDGQLIMLTQPEMFKEAQWFCDESVGSPRREPAEACVLHMVDSLQRNTTTQGEFSVSMPDVDNMTFSASVWRGINEIKNEFYPDTATVFDLTVTEWNDIGAGASVGFDGSFGEGVYYIDNAGKLMAETNNEGGAYFTCE